MLDLDPFYFWIDNTRVALEGIYESPTSYLKSMLKLFVGMFSSLSNKAMLRRRSPPNYRPFHAD
jgi:hypothetical protein